MGEINRDNLDKMWSRQDYLDGKVSHHDYYLSLAKRRGIVLDEDSLKFFGVPSLQSLKLKIAEDEHLNNIPLHRFDAMTGSYNVYHPTSSLTMSEGCCLYKALLIELAK